MRLISTILLLLCLLPCKAEEENNPFDISSELKKTTEMGIPTPAKVLELEQSALSAFKAEQWADAEIQLETYAKAANHLSNLISAGLKPYYSASSSDRKGITNISALVPIEAESNNLRKKRDRANIMRAECLAKIDRVDEAVAIYVTTLRTLSVTDQEWWDRGRNGLYAILEYKP